MVTCLLYCPQSPTVINSPLKLKLQAMSPPRCTIKPSGTTVSVTASVTITLAPPMLPEVELSKMIMVWTPERGHLCLVVTKKWAVNLFQFIMSPCICLQEGRLSAKMTLHGKALRAKLDLRRYAVDKDPGEALNF